MMDINDTELHSQYRIENNSSYSFYRMNYVELCEFRKLFS